MAPSSNLIVMDGHVHFHRGFEAHPFLESAHVNFRSAAQQVDSGASFVGVLLLTEGQRENGFKRLIAQVERQNGKGEGSASKWSVHGTKEHTSVCFTAGDHDPIIVVAGRQIPTRERLEVLAIDARRQFEEGTPISALIQEVAQRGAIPVVPWGVGKWLGRRGRLVENLIRSSDLPSFFLGDNANRPSFWPLPAHFDRAEARGIRTLPGSDPLPFPGEVQQVGSFGAALGGSLDLEKPAQDLKRKLLDPSTTLQQFGREETPVRFVRNQLKMQLRKLTR